MIVLAHCKCTSKSPCCKWCCNGEGCELGIDTHEYDEEVDNNKQIEQDAVKCILILICII